MLKPLVASKPSMKLLSFDIYPYLDWPSFFQEHLPEQGLPNEKESDTLPKNNTLLVLAQPAETGGKSHYTPGRWWSRIMLDCIQQKGLHAYGSVRILAMLPPTDMQTILTRTTGDRMRPSVLTESVALHALEIAKQYGDEEWASLKMWDMIIANHNRVAERTAAQHIVIPPGREPLSPELAPSNPRASPSDEYEPRIHTTRQDELLEKIRIGDSFNKNDYSETALTARAARSRAVAGFNVEMVRCRFRKVLSQLQLHIDKQMRDLARAAADPGSTQSRLEQLDSEIGTLKDEFAKKLASIHFRQTRTWERTLDDARVAALSNNYDDSVLIWDRRPFEPLRIHEDELYPRDPRSLIYFEANEKPPAMEMLRGLSPEKRSELTELFDILALVLGSDERTTVAEIGKALFPGRSANDLVQSMPDLAPWAGKRLKPGCGPLPLPDDTLDPTQCYQANLEYDLSDTRLRYLPITVLWRILIEYQRHGMDISVLQFARLIGATVTNFRSGGHLSRLKVR